jgi:hypothetical protein
MRIRTTLTGLVGAGIGYVLGAKAGRERFEQIKGQFQRLVNDPEVRQKVADLPNTVKENLPKAQSAVSDAAKGASDKVKGGGDDSAPADTSYIATDTTYIADEAPLSVTEPADTFGGSFTTSETPLSTTETAFTVDETVVEETPLTVEEPAYGEKGSARDV